MGLTLSEFREEMKLVGHKPFRADQIWKWIYQKGEYNVKNMTNIASRDHDSLSERFRLHPDIIPHPFVSEDGTRKWRLELDDGKSVETVYIPGWVLDEEVGCTLKCKFCHTGSMDKKILRNLSASEIISQIMCAKSHLGIANMARDGVDVLLANFSMLLVLSLLFLPSLQLLSTVSLHAPDNALRSSIMDINRMFPIEVRCLVTAATAKYVMLDGVNDSLAHAEQLAELLLRYKIHAFVNLIPFNPWPGSPYKTSSNNRVLEGYNDPLLRAAVRWPKGRDIGAACGQLATPS
eukprot:jgi/Bigna1/125667/aug1.1_g375